MNIEHWTCSVCSVSGGAWFSCMTTWWVAEADCCWKLTYFRSHCPLTLPDPVLSGPRTMKRFKICHGGLGDTTSAAPAKWNPSFLKVIRELEIRRTTTKISAGSAELSEAGTNDLTWAWSLVVTSYQWWKAASDLACDLWHELVCEDIGAHYSERDHPRVDSSQQIKPNIKAKLSGHFC